MKYKIDFESQILELFDNSPFCLLRILILGQKSLYPSFENWTTHTKIQIIYYIECVDGKFKFSAPCSEALGCINPFLPHVDMDNWVCGSDGKTYGCECYFYSKFGNWKSVCTDPPGVYIEHQGYCTGKSLQVIFHIYM